MSFIALNNTLKKKTGAKQLYGIRDKRWTD
jgi:hypothetical protein